MTKVEAALSVYKKKYKATPAELKALGYDQAPSLEFLKETVQDIICEAYVKGTYFGRCLD